MTDIRAQASPLKRVVFFARDVPILAFARAIQDAYARTSSASGDVLNHVLGPREVLESAPPQCVDPLLVGAVLDRTISFSPYGNLDSSTGAEFKEFWDAEHPGVPVAGRAARTYDALALVQTVVRALDEELGQQRRYVDIHVYRHELRHRLESVKFEGASGTHSFTNGDIGGSSQTGMYRDGKGIVTLPPPAELGKPYLLPKVRAEILEPDGLRIP
ncbi:MAG: hypothetical protein RLZZ450_1524 [Pseudomonadota bacterium]